jgi:ligand-binding sensor domain-containing protein
MKLFFLIISFCLFSLLKVYSQDMRFKHITDDDGLISNQVNAILQDSDGFMWFGTNNGLCRFDGYSFLNFFYSPTDSQSLSNNSITSLIEDKNHNIWIGTRDGLNMLNRETYKIKRLAFAFNDKSKSLSISSLVMNGDDKLWVGTNYSGLFSFDINNHQIVNYIHLSQNPLSITDNSVNCILEDKERGLFIGTVNGLDLFDPTTSTFKRILPDVDIRCLKHFNDSSIFVGVIAEGNNYYKLTADNIVEKKELPVQFTQKLTLFLLDSDGNQWISIHDNGIIYTDAHNHQIRRLLFDKYKPEGINSNTITTFYEDRLGNIWIGTFDAGINVFEKNRKAFIHVKDNFLTNGLQNNRVRSIYQDSEGDIWIGTKIGGALSKFDRKTLSFTHYRHDPKNPFSLSDDLILCITDDRPGYLWVGTSNGLNLFEKKTGKSKIFLHDPKNPNTINSNIIYALLKDGDQLFIGNVIRGLDIYNTKQNTVEHYLSSNEPGSISNNRVRVLYNDSKDNIWIGTENGLNLYNKTTKDFTHFLNDPADTNSLSDNTIQCIHEDGNQNLWIGTSSGFNLMNRQNKTFKRFTTEDGLSGNSICGILNDSKGNLWISTNNGISKFNPETKVFKNYNVYDGLQANEFSLYAYCGTKEGEMLFGGNNGFTMFNPEQITDNKIIPEVIITGFKLFNKEVSVGAPESPLKKHITQSKEITLTHNQSVISFEYVALNYSTPEKNQYAYMMEGFDPSADGWNYVGTKREATYTNLDPGDYIFRVKASNNDGLWNKKGTSIKITILPP